MSEEKTYKTTWQADVDQPELAAALREALLTVMDPELGLSVIDLGLIRDVKIDEFHIDLTMLLTTPFCPYGPAMMEITRQKAENTLKRPVDVTMSMEMWDFSMMEEGADGDWRMF